MHKITFLKIQNYIKDQYHFFKVKIIGLFYNLFYHLNGCHLPTFEEYNLPKKLSTDSFIIDNVGLPSIFHYEKKHDDLGKLFQLIQYYNPSTILEFGTSFGNTIANICKHSTAEVYTVNALPEQISGSVITGVLSKEEIGSVYRKYGYKNRVHQIYDNTLTIDLNHYISQNSIEFAIIDACHDYDYVLNDFNKILPFLTKNAIVLFHDTNPSCEGHLIGSYQACLSLREQGFDVKHIKNTWWGIWINN